MLTLQQPAHPTSIGTGVAALTSLGAIGLWYGKQH